MNSNRLKPSKQKEPLTTLLISTTSPRRPPSWLLTCETNELHYFKPPGVLVADTCRHMHSWLAPPPRPLFVLLHALGPPGQCSVVVAGVVILELLLMGKQNASTVSLQRILFALGFWLKTIIRFRIFPSTSTLPRGPSAPLIINVELYWMTFFFQFGIYWDHHWVYLFKSVTIKNYITRFS